MSGNSTSKGQFELLFRPPPEILEQFWRLRPLAWRARMPAFPDIAEWRDEFDDCSDHWAIVTEGRVIAAARLTIRDSIEQLPHPELYRDLKITMLGPVASINRLIVDAAYGGQGLSHQLDVARLAYADAAGVTIILATTFAGQRRVNALEALGFVEQGFAPHYANGPLAEVNNAQNGGGGDVAHARLMRPPPTIMMVRIRHE
jgi:GNAT superfamily N-acetyltransferase